MINIFPLSLLLTAKGSDVVIEVKAGDTYDGKLELLDKFMNVKLTNVKHTSKDGNSFHGIKELLIKGNSIKYFRLNPDAEKKAQEEAEIYEQQQQQKQQKQNEQKQQRKAQNQKSRGKSYPQKQPQQRR